MSTKQDGKNGKNGTEKTGFFKGLGKEWRKISWKSRSDVCREAGLVILLSAVMSVIIAGLDAGILQIMEFAVRL